MKTHTENLFLLPVFVVGLGLTLVGAGIRAAAAEPVPLLTASTAVTDGWVRRYDSPGTRDDVADNVAVDGSGNVIVSGHSTTAGGWDYTNLELYTAKYAAASGAILWERIANGVAPGYPDGMVLDSHGDVVVAGIAWSGTTGQCYMAKYAAADGAVIWERHFSDLRTNSFYSSPTLALDGGGNVLLTMSPGGDPAVGGTGPDYYTAKCAAADGSILWEKRYNGPGNSDDYPSAVAADTNGNVVVMGTTAILKYAASDGALLWEHRYKGATKGKFPTERMALDANGNVIGTGTIEFLNPTYGNTTYDMYTVKYSGTNGAMLWEKRFNGPGDSADMSEAVAVDRLGNVVVAGLTTANPNGDYPREVIYTAKYSGTNGALLWQQMYNNTYESHRSELAHAVGLDRADNVVVTGSVEGLNGTDFYTAKYAGANGVLLWQKRYHGPASGNNSPGFGCLALGPNGTVVVAGSSVNASGDTDFATVVYWETLPPVSMSLVPEGVRLSFTGVAARTYKIQRAPAVSGPWTTVATPTATINGLIEYLDTSVMTAPAFYRATTP